MPEHTIAENLQRLQAATAAIGNAITTKGGTVSQGDGLEEFASDIGTIPSGGGDSDLVDLIERDITSIEIPNSVTHIGQDAFSSCGALASVIMPNSVTTMGNNAFSGCGNLTSITFSNSLTNISSNCFYYCTKLTSITIPSSVTNIGSRAFEGCTKLTSITIPSSVTNIGSKAFTSSGLTTITINKPEGSISGAPWGASNATVTWTG